jgi:hypothetical protein
MGDSLGHASHGDGLHGSVLDGERRNGGSWPTLVERDSASRLSWCTRSRWCYGRKELDYEAAEVANCVSAARSPMARKERRNESNWLQRFEDIGEDLRHLAAAYGAATTTAVCLRAKSGMRR